MPERRVIGQRVPRVDALDKVTGRAAFGADLSLPGMLHGKILRSPHPHAAITRIDARQALALEGVKAVVTGEDMPPIEAGAASPLGEIGGDINYISQLVMAWGKALFAGQPVAAVAAVNPFVAEEALKLIAVEYEVLPPVLDVLEAMRPDAPLLHSGLYTETLGAKPAQPSNIAAYVAMGRGDVEKGFAAADVVLEHTYRVHSAHQGYIEPQAAVAQADPDGRVTVWTTTQGAFTAKMQLAQLLRLPLSRLRVVPMEVGGGFGGKIYVVVEPLCVLLAQKTGRPVKIVLNRAEVLQATGPGAAAVITVKTGATRDGRLTAAYARMIFDAGCFPGSPMRNALFTGLAPYRVSHLKIEGYDVVTNHARVSAYRAPGAPQAAFAIESQMDMMAEALGLDPLEFRRLNAVGEGDPLPNDRPLSLVGLREILDRIAQHPCWTSKLEGPNRGRGLAVGFWPGATSTSSAHLQLNPDGTLSLVLGSVDLTGTRTAMVQIAAEEFGVSPEEIAVTVGDTETVGYTDVSGGSRITYTMGAAVYRACQDALAQLKQRAARRLQEEEEAIEYADRQFRVKGAPDKGAPGKSLPYGKDKAISLAELARASTSGEGPIVGKGAVTRLRAALVFAAHVADVEVDQETGKVKVLNYTAFQDAGLAVNPTLVEGQIQGGAAQGIGWGLLEEYIYDQGVLLNSSLLDYRMPTALDLPMIGTEIIEVPAPDGPYGVRGVGEAPIVPPPAALANAIYRAAGVRLKEIPMTPERVFWALRAQKASVPEPP